MNAGADPDWVVVGRVGGPYGVRGWCRLTSYTQPPGNIEHYAPWLIDNGAGLRRSLPVVELREHGTGLIARFDGIGDREAAMTLTGRDIVVAREALPEVDEGEFYWRDLIGLQVLDTSGRGLGAVRELIETGAHDVLVIEDRGDNRDRLIPFVDQYVLEVDIDAQRITVDWPAAYDE